MDQQHLPHPNMVSNQRFVSVEGGEGVGKTTVIKALLNTLNACGGAPVHTTREPGGTPWAEQLRKLCLTPPDDLEALVPSAELLLMTAARIQHTYHVIQPKLAAGHWVVTDRYVDATYAYQGGGRGVASEAITWLHQWGVGGWLPGLTLLLDAPVAVGRSRMMERADTPDRIEQSDQAFFERVRDAYLARAETQSKRVVVVDATQPLEVVTSEVVGHVQCYVTSLV